MDDGLREMFVVDREQRTGVPGVGTRACEKAGVVSHAIAARLKRGAHEQNGHSGAQTGQRAKRCSGFF
jgi:hypothetical protein